MRLHSSAPHRTYNFKEARLGKDFAKEKLADFKRPINDGQSFVVLSMPGVGVSYFLKYLTMQSLPNTSIYHIDLYSLPDLNHFEFYKLVLIELGAKVSGKTEEELLVQTKNQLQSLTKNGGKIVLIFSRFDQLKKAFFNKFLSNLQSLTAVSEGNIALIFTSILPIAQICREPLDGGNLNFYSEELYFKPYHEADLRKLITLEPPRPTPKEALDRLIELSGGHNQLLQILRRSQKQQNLLLDQFVKLQLKGLIDYLNYSQRKTLQKIVLRQAQGKLFEVDEYLLGVGLVKKMSSHLEGVGLELFTPLLSEYIKLNLPHKLPVKEAKLFKLLRKNMGNVVSKDEIFTEVWPARHRYAQALAGEPENEAGATDWALDALIYRLRKHPFIKSQGYIIESHKKVGYTLIQT